jgi:ABC-2 type transport system ATP-binding protein
MVIQTFHLGKRYGKRWVVRDLNLRVNAGDIFGFLGPNGAGKSTTIRMLLGLVRPSEGRVELLGYDVQRQREQALSHVGAVVESPAFYEHLSGWKNLQMFAAMSGGAENWRIAEVIEFVGLVGRGRDPVRVYSHGMKQRLGIAQSLLPNPQLIILDEPTDGLDPAGVQEMRRLILRLREELNLTVFLSMHMLNEVEQLCNRIAILNGGKLLYQGSLDDLLTSLTPTWEVRVDAPGQALQVLSRMGCVASLDGAADTLIVQADAEQVPVVNAALVQASIKVYRIDRKRRTLEEAFLKMVSGVME